MKKIKLNPLEKKVAIGISAIFGLGTAIILANYREPLINWLDQNLMKLPSYTQNFLEYFKK